MHTVRRLLGVLVLVTSVVGCAGGSSATDTNTSTTDPRKAAPAGIPTKLRITNHVGGAHRCLMLFDDAWLQCQRSNLLVLNPRTQQIIRSLDLAADGESGPAVSMAHAGEQLAIVLEHDAVVIVDISVPALPAIDQTIPAHELGIDPRFVSAVEDDLYVSGPGGVVRLSDRRRFLAGALYAADVVKADAGLVVAVERQVRTLETDEYLGSASRLLPIAPPAEAPSAQFLFALQGTDNVTFGLMNGQIREIDSTVIPGHARSLRFFDNRAWIATENQTIGYAIYQGKLVDPYILPARGIRDLDLISANRYAIAGDGGRGIYRPRSENEKPGNSFVLSDRQPGHLQAALTDGRRIVAAGPLGSWLYTIGARAEVASKPLESHEPALTTASIVDIKASIVDNGAAIEIKNGSESQRIPSPENSSYASITAVEGDLWVGHGRGIQVFRPDPAGQWNEVDSIRIDGPVLYLFPERLARGVAFVAEFGGFGVVRIE